MRNAISFIKPELAVSSYAVGHLPSVVKRVSVGEHCVRGRDNCLCRFFGVKHGDGKDRAVGADEVENTFSCAGDAIADASNFVGGDVPRCVETVAAVGD